MDKTKLGIKTAVAVVAVALIQGVLTLYRTHVMLNVYGNQINAIVQVTLQMSAYLTLFQNGMSAAYQFKMYAPAHQQDYGKVAGLFCGLQRKTQSISVKMLMISLLIIPLYSALVVKQGVGYWDTVLIMAIISLRIVAPYFITLPERCLIDVREKRYLVDATEGIKDCVSLAVEIALIAFTRLPLPVILSVNLIFVVASKQVYLRIIKKEYNGALKYVSTPEHAPPEMTKDVMVHQIASIATSNTDNVILSVMSNLKNVTIFSSFAMLITYPSLVVNRIIWGMRASLALKITRGDENSYAAFKEMLAFSFFNVCTIVPVFLLLANPFVELWIGAQYKISSIQLLLFAAILVDSFIMPPVYAARDARGLYRESKGYAIVQACVNVVISIALARRFGITGVLCGTVAASYFVLQPGNFFLIYSKVFRRKMTMYLNLAVVAAICALSYLASKQVLALLLPVAPVSWIRLLQQAIVGAAIGTVVTTTILWFTNSGFRSLLKRFMGLLKNMLAQKRS